MSKLLRKILSATIFPAALIIVSKIAGITLVNTILNLDWGLQTNTGSWFSVQIIYSDHATAVLSNSYSNLVVILTVALGTGVLLFQSKFLNASFQNPRVLVKLIQFDFLLWLSESSVIFPKLIVWLMFLWIVSILTVAQAIQAVTYPAVAVAGLTLSIVATWFATLDFERELHTILPEHGTLKTE